MNKTLTKVVAEAIRVEHNPENDTMYLVFEIKDENFKNRIKKDWTEDIELKLLGKSLMLKDQERNAIL